MTAPVTSAFQEIFRDDFTSLDMNRWGLNWLGAEGAVTKPVNSAELAAYDPRQVTVSNGNLNLATLSSPVSVGAVTYRYRSGLVYSKDHIDPMGKRIYAEARINCPGALGKIYNWPAFWLNGDNWPEDGEIDIFEGLSGGAGYHFHCAQGAFGQGVPGDWTGWHTYGVLWEPGKSLSFFFDQTLVGSLQEGITSKPMYLILNYGVGGYGGPVRVPAAMQVDWVRVLREDATVPPAEETQLTRMENKLDRILAALGQK